MRSKIALFVLAAAVILGGPDRLPAGASTTTSAVPTAVGNELTNGGFEAATTGWKATSGTTLGVSTEARSGSAAGSLVRSSTGTAMLAANPMLAGSRPGSTCAASAWVQGVAGRAVHIRLREYAAKKFVGDHSSGAVLAAGWQRVSVSLPLTATSSQLDFTLWGSQYPGGAALLVDDQRLTCAPADASFYDGFDRAPGLITNEYAYWNPTSPLAVTSPDWQQTSGSLFARNGVAWSGRPDGSAPDALSTTATDSAVFRVNTARYDFGNVDVAFRLRVAGLTTTDRTPAQAWDGVHIFLRRRSESELYYASVDRRDGSVVIKKKCDGGTTNGGTYYTLASSPAGAYPIPLGAWQAVAAGVHDNADGSVHLQLWRDGALVLDTVDAGTGCTPLTGAGSTGIRGDNTEFEVGDFTVFNR